MENEVSRTKDVSQWKSIRVEGIFQKRIYTKSSIIKMVVCQMINYIIIQMVICHIVVLIIRGN